MLTGVMNSKIREAKQLLLDITNNLRQGNPFDDQNYLPCLYILHNRPNRYTLNNPN